MAQDIKTTFKVRNTVLEMLKARGYNLTKTPDVNFEEFMIMYDDNNYDILDDDEKIYVEFFKEFKNLNKKDLDQIVQKIKTQFGDKAEDLKLIIVLRDKPTSVIEKELLNPMYRNIQMFLYEELIFNIMRHQTMPEFILLKKAEEDELFKKISKQHLPRIKIDDPATKFYGASAGNVFKIIRTSPSSGEVITYRVVK